MSLEKQELYHQKRKVEPLTDEEIKQVNDEKFIEEKKKLVLAKFKK